MLCLSVALCVTMWGVTFIILLYDNYEWPGYEASGCYHFIDQQGTVPKVFRLTRLMDSLTWGFTATSTSLALPL